MKRTHWAWVAGVVAGVPVTIIVLLFLLGRFASASAHEKLEGRVEAVEGKVEDDRVSHAADAGELKRAIELLGRLENKVDNVTDILMKKGK